MTLSSDVPSFEQPSLTSESPGVDQEPVLGPPASRPLSWEGERRGQMSTREMGAQMEWGGGGALVSLGTNEGPKGSGVPEWVPAEEVKGHEPSCGGEKPL